MRRLRPRDVLTAVRPRVGVAERDVWTGVGRRKDGSARTVEYRPRVGWPQDDSAQKAEYQRMVGWPKGDSAQKADSQRVGWADSWTENG